MRKPTFLLALLLTSLLLLVPCTPPSFAWTDPILVTPDSSLSRHPSIVVDDEGNIHFFYSDNRYQTGGQDYDIFHSKFTSDGVRLTEDLRLTDTYTIMSHPSAILGSDNKLHVLWNDNTEFGATSLPGIYYARLNTDGTIDRQPTLMFETDSPGDPSLFMDSEGNLNMVWIEYIELLYYGKFDTSGQILIEPFIAYAPGCTLHNLEACMDGLDQIHCTYRNCWGTWYQWNLGYTRINNQGEVLVEYAPLTPEITDILCGKGSIVADGNNNLHLAYLYDEYGTALKKYRKMTPDLLPVYDYVLDYTPMTGSNTGENAIGYNSRGYVVLIMAHVGQGIEFEYRSYVYSVDGASLSAPETVYTFDTSSHYPDLYVDESDLWAFSSSGIEPGTEEGGLLYFRQDHHLGMPSVPPLSIPRDFQVSVYPNPTNSTATLSILNPQGGDVHVQVIDVAGRLVFDYGEFFLQGKRNLIMDRPLASGVYYLLIRTGAHSAVQPLVYLR